MYEGITDLDNFVDQLNSKMPSLKKTWDLPFNGDKLFECKAAF